MTTLPGTHSCCGASTDGTDRGLQEDGPAHEVCSVTHRARATQGLVNLHLLTDDTRMAPGDLQD